MDNNRNKPARIDRLKSFFRDLQAERRALYYIFDPLQHASLLVRADSEMLHSKSTREEPAHDQS